MKERYSFKKGFNCLQSPFVIKANREEYLTIINAVILLFMMKTRTHGSMKQGCQNGGMMILKIQVSNEI